MDPNGDDVALPGRAYATATDQHLTIDVVLSTGSQLCRAACDAWDQVRE